MCLLGILPDALMHLGLGFAINEIYIMSAHWVYVFPIAVACLLAKSQKRVADTLRVVIILLTVYLFIHNLGLIVGWMRQPPVSIAFWYE
jgi:hypothetical protein